MFVRVCGVEGAQVHVSAVAQSSYLRLFEFSLLELKF